MLCIMTMGLTASCSKENSTENSTSSSSLIVGKWECSYCVSHETQYGTIPPAFDSIIVMRDNRTEHQEEVGKIWEFTADGDFFTEGMPRMKYSISGNTLTFTVDGEEGSETFSIKELKSDYMSIISIFDDRASNGEGIYSTRTYQFRKKQ